MFYSIIQKPFMKQLLYVTESTIINARDTQINKNKALALCKFIYCTVSVLLNCSILQVDFVHLPGLILSSEF